MLRVHFWGGAVGESGDQKDSALKKMGTTLGYKHPVALKVVTASKLRPAQVRAFIFHFRSQLNWFHVCSCPWWVLGSAMCLCRIN